MAANEAFAARVDPPAGDAPPPEVPGADRGTPEIPNAEREALERAADSIRPSWDGVHMPLAAALRAPPVPSFESESSPDSTLRLTGSVPEFLAGLASSAPLVAARRWYRRRPALAAAAAALSGALVLYALWPSARDAPSSAPPPPAPPAQLAQARMRPDPHPPERSEDMGSRSAVPAQGLVPDAEVASKAPSVDAPALKEKPAKAARTKRRETARTTATKPSVSAAKPIAGKAGASPVKTSATLGTSPSKAVTKNKASDPIVKNPYR